MLQTINQTTRPLIALIIKRPYSLLKSPDLHNANWKQDTVYLYQFKRSPIVPNLSPFCLKIETYLRANNINYKAMPTWTIRSKNGKLPFIELNGKQIPDSQFILFHLAKHFKIEENLSPEQRGIGRAVDRMIDTSLFWPLLYFRSVENSTNFINPNVSGLPIPGFLTFFMAKKYLNAVFPNLKAQGTGALERHEIVEIIRRDLQAIDDILGDKKFLLGIRPTTSDFSLFGQLAATYYLPFRQPVTDLLDDDFPRIREHIERMRTHYWSDWKHPQ